MIADVNWTEHAMHAPSSVRPRRPPPRNDGRQPLPGFNPDTDFFQQLYPYPSGTNEYECSLDSATGTWTFKFNGMLVATHTDERWIGKVCEHAQYSGEIRHKPTQMAGTPTDKVHFTECRLKIGANWLKPSFDEAGIENDDEREWGAALPQPEQPRDAFDLWDKIKPWWPGP